MLNQLICNFATEAKERLIRTDLATHITFPNWDYEFLTTKKSSLRICYEVLEILYEIAVYRDAKHKTHFCTYNNPIKNKKHTTVTYIHTYEQNTNIRKQNIYVYTRQNLNQTF